MATRSQLKDSNKVVSRQQMQLDMIEKFVKTYDEPMKRLFEEALRLQKSYMLAFKMMQEMEVESMRNEWRQIYMNDNARYIDILSNLSKYMYSTIKQIEVTVNQDELPKLEVKITQ